MTVKTVDPRPEHHAAASAYRHVKPLFGEKAPPHRYPMVLALVPVGLLVAIVGWVVLAPLVAVGLLMALGGLLAFLALPSPIRPVAWTPSPAPPMTGVLAPNRRLAEADVLAAGLVAGPEDLALSPDGRTLYASSYGDGRILRIDVGAGAAGPVVEHAVTGGSPVDLAMRPDGSLLVCDWSKGLLLVGSSGDVSTVLPLGAMVDGRPFVRPDGVSEAPDGTIYLSEGSARPGVWSGAFEALEAGSYGRVIAYHPETADARTVVDGLSFANGNAIDPTGQFLVVADQYRYRIVRLWLAGPRAGQTDDFATNLPGLPHNLHFDAEGLLWVGFYLERNAMLDRACPSPRLKKVMAKLPMVLVEGPMRVPDGKPGRGSLVALDATGAIVHYLAGAPARVDTVSGAVRHGDQLYVSTLTGDAILRLTLRT